MVLPVEYFWCKPHDLKKLSEQWGFLFMRPYQKKIWFAFFFATTWTIWKERNARIFGEKAIKVVEANDLALMHCGWWAAIWELDFPYSSAEATQIPECLTTYEHRPSQTCTTKVCVNWIPPPPNTLKWNVDGSLKEEAGLAATRGVLRDSEGWFKRVFSYPLAVQDINEIEVIAISRVTELSIENNWFLHSKIVIESDSSKAVN